MTESEERLWEALRGRKLGVPFRRQVVIGGRFIVDFAATAVRLVVEVDGGYHATRQHADARRDRELERLGWRVLRLPAESVIRDVELAVQRVGAGMKAGARA